MAQLPTTLIHHPYAPPQGFEAPQPGVFKASTVFFPTVAAMRQRDWKNRSAYTYGLHGTPTTYVLEQRLCTLEGGLHCLLLPSGLAALALVALSLLKAGDEVLLPDNAYGNNKPLFDAEFTHWGITYQIYDPMDVADLQARISERTRLVWLEAAGSVTLEFPDLPAMVRLCKARGVLTALDNTWGAGLAFAPFDLLPTQEPGLGVDISAHALTKYPSGGGDVLMGSVITRSPNLHQQLQATHMRLGFNVAANDAEAVLRALPSMALRYAAHDAAARTLAQWCTQQPQFVQVLHPALPTSPGHAHWRVVCQSAAVGGQADGANSDANGGAGRAAGLFSVVIASEYSQRQVDAFCESLQLFRIGWSWGGPVSLVVPYKLASMRTRWPAHISRGTVVRFAIGLESVADLQADLAQALRTLQ
ncbi:MAG: PLP-dependent transferase [Burkholderiales bacterium]|nr:PLP-dependent transferase [Burkholderiales bacterium]